MKTQKLKLRLLSTLLCIFMLIPSFSFTAFGYAVPDGASASYTAAVEGMVLLKNDKDALPLKSTDKIAVFGEGQVYTDGRTGGYFLMGRGSGKFVPHKTPSSPYDLLSSYASKGKLGGVYSDLVSSYKKAASAAPETDFPYSPTAAQITAAAGYANKAIYILNRTSTEGADNSEANFYLTAHEKEDLERICAAFAPKPVIVVLNTGYAMSCDFALGGVDGIYADALLTAPYLGICGVEALCDVLVGDVNPSGKTVDTYARKISDYPSYANFSQNQLYANYEEDIYVGYRYFETFKQEAVDFPFGFGLSYTSFSISDTQYNEADGKITVSVKVTNTGNKAGKEVVELYFSAPQKGTGDAKLSKAARELCGFAKTKLLSPGQSETVSVSFDVDTMASYDDLGVTSHRSAYVLEAGDYTVHVGNSVRNTVVAGIHKESALRVVEQLSELCEPTTPFNRMTFDGKEQVGKSSNSRTDILHKDTDLKTTLPEKPIQFSEVATGKVSLDEFLSQMTAEELCSFSVMQLSSSGNTKGWGASEQISEKYGIPVADTCDGPAGLRTTTKATGLPCATALACTWNIDAIAALGDVVGREALLSEVDVWLAPAVNIHRLPLCGRNFEYYSEDPYLSGVLASKLIEKVEAHGIACSVKHFVGNEREYYRSTMSSNMSERALREIYLEPFRYAVEAGVSTLMTSYNKLNGTETAENAELLRGILRGEWGFDGLITTDWSNAGTTLEGELIGGNNVHSSTDATKLSTQSLISAYQSGKVSRSLLCENASYVLELILNTPDGKRLAAPEVIKIKSSGKTKFEAEDYTFKHAYIRPEISSNRTVLAYTKSNGTEWTPYVCYTLDVESAGWYFLDVDLANNASVMVSDALEVFVNGKEQPCAFNALNTGGWAAVKTLPVTKVYLDEGINTLKIKCTKNRSCGNFDAFYITPHAELYTDISTAEQLIELMNDPSKWGKKYRLSSDIDLTGMTGMTAIGTYSKNFTGHFDGMGHSITGLDMTTSTERDFGLFGKVKNAYIADLRIYGRISSEYPGAVVGGIVGTLDPRSVILGCENHAEVTYSDVTTDAKGVGGIAGYIYSGSERSGSVIKNSTNYGTVNSKSGGSSSKAGGIAGVLNNSGAGMSEIVDSLNLGTVNGEGSRVGGIVGYAYQNANGGGCFISGCENRANVTSSGAEVGGIVGYMTTASANEELMLAVVGCINRGDVSGASDTGNIHGKKDSGRISDCVDLPPLPEPEETTPPESVLTPETETNSDNGETDPTMILIGAAAAIIAAVVIAVGGAIFAALKYDPKKPKDKTVAKDTETKE